MLVSLIPTPLICILATRINLLVLIQVQNLGFFEGIKKTFILLKIFLAKKVFNLIMTPAEYCMNAKAFTVNKYNTLGLRGGDTRYKINYKKTPLIFLREFFYF